MWSFGCIIAELYTGKALFPAVDENELMELINMMIGYPDVEMITKAKKRNQFYDKDGNVIISKRSRVNGVETLSDPLQVALQIKDKELCDFLLVRILHKFKN